MKHYLLLAMVLLLASCQKSTTKPQTASESIDDGMAFVDTTNAGVETVSDVTYFYNDDPNGGYVFDSCTNEWVHVWGKIHSRMVNWFADSVKQINTAQVDYQGVQGVGNVTGQKYKYNYSAKSIQYSEWGGEWFVEKVNFFHARSKLIPESGGAFVTDTYYYFVSDNAGDLIINQEHYDLGSCH
jgi:hypothetical protein